METDVAREEYKVSFEIDPETRKVGRIKKDIQYQMSAGAEDWDGKIPIVKGERSSSRFPNSIGNPHAEATPLPLRAMKYLLILTLGILLALQSLAKADSNSFSTRNFPQPDRAEVIATVSQDPDDGPKVEISASKARKLAALIRAQTWMGTAAACDKPQFCLRFYADKKLISADTICFYCGCFAPLHSDAHSDSAPQSFDTRTVAAKTLQTFLAKLFP
jgi:hypothetical protein